MKVKLGVEWGTVPPETANFLILGICFPIRAYLLSDSYKIFRVLRRNYAAFMCIEQTGIIGIFAQQIKSHASNVLQYWQDIFRPAVAI